VASGRIKLLFAVLQRPISLRHDALLLDPGESEGSARSREIDAMIRGATGSTDSPLSETSLQDDVGFVSCCGGAF
jgi:hypothetical protein